MEKKGNNVGFNAAIANKVDDDDFNSNKNKDEDKNKNNHNAKMTKILFKKRF